MPNEKRQRQKAGRQQRQEQIRAAQKRRRQRNQIIFLAGVAVLVAAVAFLSTRGGGKSTSSKTSTTAANGGPPTGKPVATSESITGDTPCPKADGSSKATFKFAKTPPMCIDPAKTYTAHVSTSEGDFDIALDTKKTPNTANNFVVLSRYHYYDGTTIARIDNSIDILQTGSPHTQTIADPGPGYTIKDEGSGFQYSEGDVVMARSSGPDSGAAQYFLAYGPQVSQLNGQGTYVTFGKVSGPGLDVLKKIGALFQACAAGDQSCLGGAPSRLVTIKTIDIKES
ncbi:MAG TPA: peptidylprolyl isomerase [Acidimicrobiales bacterium]|nr:peptidylprolyl isomerase [Acidimicrobiales bacterium]